MAPNEPRIVAELGRPETAQETADRKAAATRRHRTNQTALNLVFATIASLAIVLFLVVVVVRPEPAAVDPIDFTAVAADTGEAVVVPRLPDGWTANAATFETRSGVPTWYLGLITPETQFIALEQGFDANPTWLDATLSGVAATDSATIAGLEWTLYDNRTADDPGNYAFSMSTQAEGTTIVLHGTASDDEFRLLAESIGAEIGGS